MLRKIECNLHLYKHAKSQVMKYQLQRWKIRTENLQGFLSRLDEFNDYFYNVSDFKS